MARQRYRNLQVLAGTIFGFFALVLIANSLFLFTSPEATSWVAAMVTIHVWLGYGLSVAFFAFLLPHLTLRLGHANGRARAIGAGVAVLIGVGVVTGFILRFIGKSSAVDAIVVAHEVTFTAAIVGYVVHRFAARPRPALRFEAGALVASLALAIGIWGAHREAMAPPPGGGGTGDGLVATVLDVKPSRVSTVTGHWLGEDDLGNPEYCAQCHEEIAEQWSGSAHRFSSFNDPFYAATFFDFQEREGDSGTEFCGGCHDPLVLLTGNMTRNDVSEETTNAQEGITCLACHSIRAVKDRRGNAGYVIDAPEHYPFYDSEDPDDQELNRKLIRSKPAKHKAEFMRAELREPEFCLPCHKAHLDVPVNGFRWLRGQNDYDAWHSTAAAMKSARTFYNGTEVKRCQDCHMKDVPSEDPAAGDGYARDHSFASANTAVAFLKNETEWLRKAQELLRDCASIDIVAAVVGGEGSPPSTLLPLDDPGAMLAAGSEAQLEVVVRNRTSGHMLPGGTIDLADIWVELIVEADRRPLLASGLMNPDLTVDEGAHRLHSVLLDENAERIDIHNVEDIRVQLYNHAMPLGASDVVHYPLTVPIDARSLTVRARLLHRKFPRDYVEYTLGEDAPAMPVTLIATDSTSIRVGARTVEPTVLDVAVDAIRVNDYGIAQLRQGSTGSALAAFTEVTDLLPDDVDAWVNRARCHLRDGNLTAMETALRKADSVKPGYHKTAYFLGRLRAAEGRYDEAVAAYDVVLESFPEDRVVLNDKGTALYKSGHYARAIGSFMATLEIDPENLTAVSYLSRCYRELGDEAETARYETLTLRYRVDESTRALTEKYRAENPHANRNANARHVTPLLPYPTEPGGARPAVLRPKPL